MDSKIPILNASKNVTIRRPSAIKLPINPTRSEPKSRRDQRLATPSPRTPVFLVRKSLDSIQLLNAPRKSTNPSDFLLNRYKSMEDAYGRSLNQLNLLKTENLILTEENAFLKVEIESYQEENLELKRQMTALKRRLPRASEVRKKNLSQRLFHYIFFVSKPAPVREVQEHFEDEDIACGPPSLKEWKDYFKEKSNF